MKEVLTITVTYNAMRWIESCIGSIIDSNVKSDMLIIDNCSSDGTPEYIEEHYPEVTLIKNNVNAGFGAANNIGLRMAVSRGYKFVYLLNQDAWLEKNTLGNMLKVYNPAYGILSPVQKDAKGKLDKNFKKKCGRALKAYRRESFHAIEGIAEVDFVMAAHWLVDVRTIEAVGGFSPVFKQYGEDDNYIDRLHFFGLKAGVVVGAEAVHDRESRKLPREKRMRLKCLGSVVRLCNPMNSFFGRSLAEPLRLVGTGMLHFSSIPFKYIPQLLSRYEELRKSRKASKKQGAFL